MTDTVEQDPQEDNRRAITLVAIVAAAAGIAVVSYLYYWRTRPVRDQAALRSVADRLDDLGHRLQQLHEQMRIRA